MRMRWSLAWLWFLMCHDGSMAWSPHRLSPSLCSLTRRQGSSSSPSLVLSSLATRSDSLPNYDEYHVDRRTFVGNIICHANCFLLLLSAGTLSLPQSAHAAAAAPATVGAAVRRSAANLPGYGPTDVFFPKSWAGLWRVQRQVSFGTTTSAPASETSGSKNTVRVLEYTIRFVPSIENDAVVADRGFNQANLEVAASSNAARLPPPLAQWASSNPNDLRLAWPADGRVKDIKVTQRATDYQQIANGRLWSSEVQRVTNDGSGNNASAVPMITARRVVTQYRWEPTASATNNDAPPNLVQALEVIYDLGGTTDPLKTASPNNNDNILSKSRIIMQKLEAANQ